MQTHDSTRRLVLSALLILGAAAGLAVGLLNRLGATTQWTSLLSPPEPTGQILAASEAGLWIEARSGARYFLTPLDVAAGWTVTDASNAPGALVQPALPVHVTRPALGRVLPRSTSRPKSMASQYTSAAQSTMAVRCIDGAIATHREAL